MQARRVEPGEDHGGVASTSALVSPAGRSAYRHLTTPTRIGADYGEVRLPRRLGDGPSPCALPRTTPTLPSRPTTPVELAQNHQQRRATLPPTPAATQFSQQGVLTLTPQGFIQFRPGGEPRLLDVAALNEDLKASGALRMRYRMNPDEAYGCIFDFDTVRAQTLASALWLSHVSRTTAGCLACLRSWQSPSPST